MTRDSPSFPALSVVLISKNQAWNVARLVESVLQETESLPDRELVLVDSASTDATVDVARRYPVRILRLDPGQHLGPAAGRYVGYCHTLGSLVLFLDGDSELYPGWLDKAIRLLGANQDIAVVTGRVITLPSMASGSDELPTLAHSDAYGDIQHCGGMALYRRATLEQVGCFNPYLCSDEEPEICIRIRHAGYRIVSTESPIAYEYTDAKDALSTKLMRWRRDLYLGAGQNLRYHLGRATFWRYIAERGYGLAPLAWLTLGAVSVGLLAGGRSGWLVGWSVVSGAAIVLDLVRRRSPYQTLSSVLERILIVDGTVRGFLRRPRPPETYPGRHEAVEGPPGPPLSHQETAPPAGRLAGKRSPEPA